MKRLVVLALLLGVAICVSAIALATPPSGVTTTNIAVGRFDVIDVNCCSTGTRGKNHDDGSGSQGSEGQCENGKCSTKTDPWTAKIRTNAPSDLYVLQNTIAPGGTFGWHSHPGPSLVIVKSGTATFYMADDPKCTPHVVPAGSGFVDAGGGDIHVVRNEGKVDLVTIVTSLVPAGAARRIDQPSPGNCPF